MRFLSDDHFASANAAFAADEFLRRHALDVNLAVVYHVVDSPEGKFTYHIKIANGTVVMGRGPLPEPDSEVHSSYETTAQMSRGELANQTALLMGKVRIKGGMMKLVRHQAVLSRIQSLTAACDLTY